MHTLFSWISEKYRHARHLYHILAPARASLLASLLVPILFLTLDQGRDCLHGLVSNPKGDFSLQAFCAFFGIFLVGFASWAWAKFLLNCSFGDHPPPSPPEAYDESARTIMRRACGWIPPIGLGLAFLYLCFHSEAQKVGYLVSAFICFLIAALLFKAFEVVRRRRAPRIPILITAPLRHHNLHDIRRDPQLLRSTRFSVVLSVVFFIVLTFWPVTIGQRIGSVGVILFAITLWICLGSWVIYWSHVYRVPIFTLLVALAVGFSPFNDNHTIREFGIAAPKPTLPEAVTSWYQFATNRYGVPTAQKPLPLFIVAAAGGGIRAAYWTANVLGALEDQARDRGTRFSDFVFALSGVSGGSLGEVTYLGLVRDDLPPDKHYRNRATRLLGHDFLAADLAKMAYGDFLQRFLFFPVPIFDRARSLEDAWAAAWRENGSSSLLDLSMSEFYAPARKNTNMFLPHIFLNGTSVEQGKRIITSDLQLCTTNRDGAVSQGQFIDIYSADEKLGGKDIRMSTAIHQSARFTYFSPAGRFPGDGTRIVDGGYFENSGTATVMDLFDSIQAVITSNNWQHIDMRVVAIDNEPIRKRSGDKARAAQIQEHQGEYWSDFLSESTAPVRALLATRQAHGAYSSRRTAARLVREKDIYNGAIAFAEFHLYSRDVNLPLSWTLSKLGMNEMDSQVTAKFPFPGYPDVDNPSSILGVIDGLPKPPPVAVR